MPKQTRPSRPRQDPGRLIMPHGPNSWHFAMGNVHGTGFSGQVKHMWHPGRDSMLIPGKGFVKAT